MHESRKGCKLQDFQKLTWRGWEWGNAPLEQLVTLSQCTSTFCSFLTTDQRWHPSKTLLPIQSPKNCSRPGYPHLVVMYREPLAPSGWQVNDHWEQNIKVVVGADLKQLTCNSESVLNMPDFWQTFSSVQVRPLRYISAGHWCGWGSEALWGRKTEQVITVFVSTLIWLNLTRLPSKTLAVLLISKDVDIAWMTFAKMIKSTIECSISCRCVAESYSTLKLLCNTENIHQGFIGGTGRRDEIKLKPNRIGLILSN